jgi:hypothetical protein
VCRRAGTNIGEERPRLGPDLQRGEQLASYMCSLILASSTH